MLVEASKMEDCEDEDACGCWFRCIRPEDDVGGEVRAYMGSIDVSSHLSELHDDTTAKDRSMCQICLLVLAEFCIWCT